MKLRTLIIVVALLAAAEAVVLWRAARRDDSGGTAFVDTALLEVKDLERAHRIVVREKPQSKLMPGSEEGFEVRLIVEKDAPIRETVLERRGEAWVVANCFQLEADMGWLGQTMRDLSQGRLTRFVTSDPALTSDLDLHLGQVRLEDAAGKVIRQLEFGRKDGGNSYQFVRINQGDVFVAKHETELVGDPYSWIVSRVFSFTAAEVKEVSLPLQDSQAPALLLRRPEKGKPFELQNDPAPDAARVAQHAESVLTRLLAEPIMVAFAADSPVAKASRHHVQARMHLTLFDQRTYAVAYAVIPAGDPALSTITEDIRNDLAFAWVEASDKNDLVMRYTAKAALAYNRNGIIARLPANRAAAAGRPASESSGEAPPPNP